MSRCKRQRIITYKGRDLNTEESNSDVHNEKDKNSGLTFADLPIDIIFNIAHYIPPEEFSIISSASKKLRQVYNSRSYWKSWTVLANAKTGSAERASNDINQIRIKQAAYINRYIKRRLEMKWFNTDCTTRFVLLSPKLRIGQMTSEELLLINIIDFGDDLVQCIKDNFVDRTNIAERKIAEIILYTVLYKQGYVSVKMALDQTNRVVNNWRLPWIDSIIHLIANTPIVEYENKIISSSRKSLFTNNVYRHTYFKGEDGEIRVNKSLLNCRLTGLPAYFCADMYIYDKVRKTQARLNKSMLISHLDQIKSMIDKNKVNNN